MPLRPMSLRPEAGPRGEALAGRYRLDALLGQGGAAEVYQGLDLRLRRPVAVKVFRGGEAQTEERFHEEAVLLAQLQHPGLVTVYDSGRDGGSPFLVMHLIKGSTLRARVARGPMPPSAVRALGAALSDALAYVHAAGVVHRDVKPSNILLDEDGAPHLADFGISRLIDSTVRTATGALVGTAAYLAPEQVMGREVGPAADVYALGLTLLECLKGELEYDGAPLEAAIARLHRAPALPAVADEELTGLLRAMTALDENERPSARSCADVLRATGVPGAAAVPAAPAAGTGVTRLAAERPTPAPAVTGRWEEDAVRASHEVSAARRRSGRTLATVGAALATLLGVTLTGSIGDLTGQGADTASGSNAHRPAAPATEPSSAPAEPAQKRTDPGTAAPVTRATAGNGASPAHSASAARETEASGRDAKVTKGASQPLPASAKDEAPADPAKAKAKAAKKQSGKQGEHAKER